MYMHDVTKIIKKSISRGRINKVKNTMELYLFQTKKPISFFPDNDIFVWCCRNYPTHYAKKLFDYPNKIILEKCIDVAFIESCKSKYQTTPKWLLSLDQNIDINANNNQSFINSYMFCNVETLKLFLCEDYIDPHKRVMMDNIINDYELLKKCLVHCCSNFCHDDDYIRIIEILAIVDYSVISSNIKCFLELKKYWCSFDKLTKIMNSVNKKKDFYFYVCRGSYNNLQTNNIYIVVPLDYEDIPDYYICEYEFFKIISLSKYEDELLYCYENYRQHYESFNKKRA